MTGWTRSGRAGRPMAVVSCLRGTSGRDAHLAVHARLGTPGPQLRRLTDRKDPEYNGAFSPDGIAGAVRGDHALGDPGQPRYRVDQRRRHRVEDRVRGTGPALAPGLAVVVARRPPVRVQLDPRGQPGDLHGRRRRQGPGPADEQPRDRRAPIAGRPTADRSPSRPTDGAAWSSPRSGPTAPACCG